VKLGFLLPSLAMPMSPVATPTTALCQSYSTSLPDRRGQRQQAARASEQQWQCGVYHMWLMPVAEKQHCSQQPSAHCCNTCGGWLAPGFVAGTVNAAADVTDGMLISMLQLLYFCQRPQGSPPAAVMRARWSRDPYSG
jgi:hypothetical protein